MVAENVGREMGWRRNRRREGEKEGKERHWMRVGGKG